MNVSLALTPPHHDAAFLAALEATAPAMMALATRMLRDPEDAREVLQDAWFRAWKGRGALRDGDAVNGWVRAIVVRECLRRLRWRSVRLFLGVETDVPVPAASHEDADLVRRVRARVDRLPARQRLIWGLRFDEGWTLPEIAVATGISVETVKTHLGRALAVVREVTHGL